MSLKVYQYSYFLLPPLMKPDLEEDVPEDDPLTLNQNLE